ncbi:Long chronological lifespan protein 2 [Tilletia horrida]|uniref:Long chronological lifespan protein 2 n=1 Tax=Tilletia horrida TaxID=155126 RepID=A0AAN6GF40_9BASI|nr:Long chronological lifespan protein 2 [Tilletia horrida]KAK0538065.1 Long chronological lifespan protein 2 [Tilletia horrida]KAK0538734.1 Long chronological lifespan protein 2 [Tilletia horrida]KAK0561672.1 Long chronological lifespan protein 2 [Tilletia horrida]
MRWPSLPQTDALPRQTLLLFVLALLASAVPPLVSAQGFFSNFFSGHHQGEQEAPPLGDAKWFNDRVEAASCTEYLCPKTLSCVSRPEQCPCPFPQQIACAYPDFEPEDGEDAASAGSRKGKAAGVVCVTGTECGQVQRLLRVGSGFKLKDLKA